MEKLKNRTELTRKKVMGLLGLLLFSLVFIFSCLEKVLPVGKFFVGAFGIMIFPISFISAFLCLAAFLGFSYTRSKKSTTYFVLALIGLLFAIHSITTFDSLDAAVTWKTFKAYLTYSYQNTTLLGGFGSVFCGLISMLFGGMGAIITSVILTTIFSGLFIDYQLYGKFEAPHIKKLKTKKIREKVSNSDNFASSNGTPNYSFENNEQVGEVSVNAETYESETLNSNASSYSYSDDDVVDEITDETISNSNFDKSNNYFGSSNFNTIDDEPQTQNQFSQTVYEEKTTYPDVYSSEMDDYRRQFMNATFGRSEEPAPSSNDQPQNNNFDPIANTSTFEQTNNFDFQTGEPEIAKPTYLNNFSDSNFGEGSVETNSTRSSYESSNIDDEISKILNSSEDDEDDIVNSVNPPSTDFGFGKTFETPVQNIKSQEKEPSNELLNNNIYAQTNKPIEEQKNASNSNFNSSVYSEQNKANSDDFAARNQGFSTSGFASGLSQNLQEKPQVPTAQRPAGSNFASQSQTNNFGFGVASANITPSSNYENSAQQSVVSASKNVVVPAKETKPIQGLNLAMTGVRYNPPPLSLLRPAKPDNGDYTEEQNRKSAKLESVLEAFNIPAKVKNIVRGPKITRYELSVPLGVSVKGIPKYEDDIAAALAAKTIVIKAPIPGSPYVGIELENDTFSSVYERELLESDAFQNFKDPLPIAIGKDISGEIVVKSLAKMVHLLIAGSTGSGKSVFIHNIVMSLIYKSSPDDLRLIMIDPKKVEFNRYNGLPHLLTPEVVMGSDKAINALKWSVKEMERRYDLMSKAGYNNIEPYNKSELVKAGQFDRFPYIVIIVDELAEIMMVNKKEVEACIQRLTQLARACGMHLILATQRPSVDIISGVIKNNVPSRIAFSLQSGIDSKTILNATGAEKLLGQGDMIFAPTGTSATPRLQAAYASDEEIKAVIDYDIKYNKANYDESVNNIINAEQSQEDSSPTFNGGDGVPTKDTVDGYFKTAVKLVMQNGGASVSYLQRRLSIGYSRAARIIDQMEDKGYIAGATGSKVRKVLITPDQFYEEFGEAYDSID